MAEEEGGGLGRIGGIDLSRKVGPLPLWGWLLGTTAAGWFILKSHKTTPGGTGGAGGAQQGQFSTSTTTTDPKTGNQTTYSASGPNSSITSPAQLMWGAGPMGYSGGDVFFNNPPGGTGPAGPPGPTGTPGPTGPPGPTPPPQTTPPPDQGPPPPTPPPSQSNPDANVGAWVTVQPWDNDNPPFGTPSSLWGIAEQRYGDGTLWPQIWNDPVNAAEKALRGDPTNIQPGDLIWAFDGWQPGWQAPAGFVPWDGGPVVPGTTPSASGGFEGQ